MNNNNNNNLYYNTNINIRDYNKNKINNKDYYLELKEKNYYYYLDLKDTSLSSKIENIDDLIKYDNKYFFNIYNLKDLINIILYKKN